MHQWPSTVEGKPISPRARVSVGTLVVPPHLPPGILAYMEEEYRSRLWPRPDAGMCRLAREFQWDERGRVLHYRIIDVPSAKS